MLKAQFNLSGVEHGAGLFQNEELEILFTLKFLILTSLHNLSMKINLNKTICNLLSLNLIRPFLNPSCSLHTHTPPTPCKCDTHTQASYIGLLPFPPTTRTFVQSVGFLPHSIALSTFHPIFFVLFCF